MHTIGWAILERRFNLLCDTLPHNYQLTIAKLKTMPHLPKDEGVHFSKLISSLSSSSSTDIKKINGKIVTYLIVKLCYSGRDNSSVRLCGVMDKLNSSTDSASSIQQVGYGEYSYIPYNQLFHKEFIFTFFATDVENL